MSALMGKAVVNFGPGIPWEMREYPVPSPKPGAMVLKISMASICGSDVHAYLGEFGGPKGVRQKPSILGHEFVGRVHELGEGVCTDTVGRRLEVGDRVLWSPSMLCGRCPSCLREVVPCPNRKEHQGTTSDDWPHFKGAFAEYYYLNPGQWVYKVPDVVPDSAAVYVDCAAATVAYALTKVDFPMGSWGLIQGAGGLGLCAAPMMKDRGARVIVVDKRAERLELARAFGADHTIDGTEYPTPESRIERVRELTKGVGPEVVLEVVAGAPEVVPEGLEMLAIGGTYLTVGLVGPYPVTIEMGPFINKGLRLIGSAQFKAATMADVLDLMERTIDKYPWDKVISHTFRLEDTEEAIKQAAAGKVVRAAVVMD
ncbi:MAG: zinc-binding dehydrogenase [Actinobacteria bacterium]|nr:zinc-binding dehydrogenase [Actinomycetota bacterium]